MSKRRLQSSSDDDDTPVESLTPEERRERRRRERAQERSGKIRKGLGTPARRGAIIGTAAAAIILVVLLIFYNPFNVASPCLSLSPANTQPYYPPAGTTDFSRSWCPPPGPTLVYEVEPQLRIEINGNNVPLPAGIGVNRSFGTYTCDLPITTPTTAGELPAGVFEIASLWSYSFNLTWFFQDWQATFGTVDVNSSNPSQPVLYTPNDLLGFTTDSTHAIHLFVDNRQSSAGPSLDLSTLPYLGSPFPGCISSVYGTGHTILLTYGATSGTAVVRGPVDPTLSTAWAPFAGAPQAPLRELAGNPVLGTTVAFGTGAAIASLAFLVARVERR